MSALRPTDSAVIFSCSVFRWLMRFFASPWFYSPNRKAHKNKLKSKQWQQWWVCFVELYYLAVGFESKEQTWLFPRRHVFLAEADAECAASFISSPLSGVSFSVGSMSAWLMVWAFAGWEWQCHCADQYFWPELWHFHSVTIPLWICRWFRRNYKYLGSYWQQRGLANGLICLDFVWRPECSPGIVAALS